MEALPLICFLLDCPPATPHMLPALCIHCAISPLSFTPLKAACEMLSTAGAKVAKSESDKMRRKLDDVFKQLQLLEKDKALSSRIRFVIRDVIVG